MDDEDATSMERRVEANSKSYYFSAQQLGIDNKTKLFVIEKCMPFVRKSHVVELGFVDGLWTDILIEHGYRVDIVEGAKKHIQNAHSKYKDVKSIRVFHDLFERFVPEMKYDTIIAGDMLQYVSDTVGFINRTRDWLKDDGVLIVTTPNKKSLHRRIGALIGIDSSPSKPNKRDLEVGNLRLFDKYDLREALLEGGYEIQILRGCFLKPLSSGQIENWSDSLLRAFLEAGEELGDYCWFLYAVCKKAA